MYSKLGLGGERLNASDINNLMNTYHRKVKASFSNKVLELINIKDAGLLLKNSSDIFHFLFESVERITYKSDGSRWSTGLTFDYGDLIEDDIVDVEIKLASDLSTASHSVVNVDSNRTTPYLLKTHDGGDYYIEYWYSYTMLTIELNDIDTQRLYILTKVLDSSATTIDFYNSTTTMRSSYGDLDIFTPPVAFQNRDLTGNVTSLMKDVFAHNTNLIFFHTYDKSTPVSINFYDMFVKTKVNSFKIFIINDNSTNSGLAFSGGLDIASYSNLLLSSGRYLHSHIINYDAILINNGSEIETPTLDLSGSYATEGIVIELGNSQNEFNELNPKSIKEMVSETPLTNILLSYMKYITEFAIYNYTIQNYTFTLAGAPLILEAQNLIKTEGYEDYYLRYAGNESIVNNHLMLSGALYHLGDLTNMNDGDFLSWQVNQL